MLRATVAKNLIKWLILSILVGVLSGSASALFLFTLEFVTNFRETHPWILALLPLGGAHHWSSLSSLR